MKRTFIGAGLGASISCFIGIIVTFHFVHSFSSSAQEASVFGLLLGGLGAIAGAVIGGVADILSFLRETFGDRVEKELRADYIDPPQPPRPGT